MCAEIVAFHPDIVITEKGVSGAFARLDRLIVGVFGVCVFCTYYRAIDWRADRDTCIHILTYEPNNAPNKPHSDRPGAALPAQGGHHRLPPHPQERQQPHRAVRTHAYISGAWMAVDDGVWMDERVLPTRRSSIPMPHQPTHTYTPQSNPPITTYCAQLNLTNTINPFLPQNDTHMTGRWARPS